MSLDLFNNSYSKKNSLIRKAVRQINTHMQRNREKEQASLERSPIYLFNLQILAAFGAGPGWREESEMPFGFLLLSGEVSCI